MRSYETARTIFGILEFVAWVTVVGGLIAAFAGANAGSYYSRSFAGLLGALPGIALSVVGLIAAAVVQNSRAGVDTAEMTGKMLRIAEEQFKIARGDAHATFATAASSQSRSYPSKSDLTVQREDLPEPDMVSNETKGVVKKIMMFQGVRIAITDSGCYLGNLRFTDRDQAQDYIERAKLLGLSLPAEALESTDQ